MLIGKLFVVGCPEPVSDAFWLSRNVMCSAIPTHSKLHAEVYEFSKRVSEHLLPRTTAYHEIWLDKYLVAGQAIQDFEPLYGELYLPRKVGFCFSASQLRRQL